MRLFIKRDIFYTHYNLSLYTARTYMYTERSEYFTLHKNDGNYIYLRFFLRHFHYFRNVKYSHHPVYTQRC